MDESDVKRCSVVEGEIMGTSQSSPGPGRHTPLVPPWADDQPQLPLPVPQPSRFNSFRQALGRFVKSGNGDYLKSALGHYARTGSGGGSTGARRLGSVSKAGANFYGALTGVGAFGISSGTPITLDDLVGQPCDVAINAIVRALTPPDGDAEKIRVAMNHALVEALDGIEIFDLDCITDSVIVNTMLGFLAESIFLQIVMDAGDAWKKAGTANRENAASNDLWELIKAVVDRHMAPKLAGKVRFFERSEMILLEREVIVEVWKEWEDYQ